MFAVYETPHQPETGDKRAVLIATPDVAYGNTLSNFLSLDPYLLEQCHDSKGVFRLAGRRQFDVVLLDLALSEETDLELVSFVQRQAPGTQIVLLFDVEHVDKALDGIRHGAYFYLPKSCQPSDVAMIVGKAIDALDTQSTVQNYEQGLFEDTVGSSPAMKRVVELITKVAPTDSTVLLLGESGTGKEVVANAIHRLSPRRDKPFIAINCAALPEQLLESELFGHVRGSFTGADTDKVGLFEEADGGTVFLDEVGDTSPGMQAKLLRVLQNGEIRRVGDATTRRVDVRVLAATNRDLLEAVQEKEFREDLYFRLNVIQIAIPPLRKRTDVLPSLVNQFLRRFNRKFNRDVKNIDDHAWSLLQQYDYPGNVRELESIVAHAVILCEGDTIRARDLPDSVRLGETRLALPNPGSEEIPTLEAMEKRLIETALEKLEGNQTEVAKKLGISRSTLWRKMKEYNLSPKDKEKEEAETVA